MIRSPCEVTFHGTPFLVHRLSSYCIVSAICCIPDTNSLCVCVVNIFSHLMACFFCTLNGVFWRAKVLNLIKYNLLIFNGSYFCVFWRNHCLVMITKMFFYISSISFFILVVTFRSMIHFEVVFELVWSKGHSYFDGLCCFLVLRLSLKFDDAKNPKVLDIR